jgi:ubiquinone/menaquinone biosynthesis C-methylase UbiE
MALPFLRQALDLFHATFPNVRKHRAELDFWRGLFKLESGTLWNGHFEPLLTGVYGLTRNDYCGKKILDVGCGPCGSLEWATMAAERVGIDPLARKYMKLGAAKHAMSYVAAPSERIPFSNGYFDIVLFECA